AIDVDERARLVKDLGDNPVMILRNHGLLAVGKSVPLAFSNLFNLQFACETQVLAMAATPRFRFPQPPSRSTPPGSPSPRTPRSGRNGRACSASSTASILRIAPEGVRVRALAPPARDTSYLYPLACAFSRVAVSEMVGVSASGSTLRWRIAGWPDFCAASSAGKKPAVFSTIPP